MPGTYHPRRCVHHGTHHERHDRWHVPPGLPGLKAGPAIVLPVRRKSFQEQYREWTDQPATLQVVDKVGATILEIPVTRETNMDHIRALVVKKLRKRHAHVLDAPVHGEGGRHRTYTVLADVSLYKIENLADAFSGELRELCAGERVDGCKQMNGCAWACCRCLGRLVSAELGYVIRPPKKVTTTAITEALALEGSLEGVFKDASAAAPHSTHAPAPGTRVTKLLYKSVLQSAKSHSSHRDSWTSHDRWEDSWHSPSPKPSSSDSSGGWSGGGGGSCGGGSG